VSENSKNSTVKYLLKEFRMPIITFGILAFVVVYFLTRSFGWFAKNGSVDAKNMSVKVQQSENLIISTEKSKIQNYNSSYGNLTTCHFDFPSNNLVPCALDTTDNKLKYVTNLEDIDPVTGLATGDLEYAEALESRHYYDCVFYLGSISDNFSYNNIKISLDTDNMFYHCLEGTKAVNGVRYFSFNSDTQQYTLVNGLEAGVSDVSSYYTQTPNNDEAFAFSYAAYVGEGSSMNFVGNTSVYDDNVITLVSTAGTLVNSSPIKVTLRCYFDGGLTYVDGNSFITSAGFSTSGLSFAVAVTAN